MKNELHNTATKETPRIFVCGKPNKGKTMERVNSQDNITSYMRLQKQAHYWMARYLKSLFLRYNWLTTKRSELRKLQPHMHKISSS